MWRLIGRIFAMIIGWGAVLAFIIYASLLSREQRAEMRVKQIVISLPDNDGVNGFTTPEQIRHILDKSGLQIENELIDSLDIAGISKHIAQNGFVRDVNSYVSNVGNLYIDVTQQKPIVRFMSGGFNSYVTEEREIFRSPKGSAYYAPVVTGNYTPLFPRNYEGDVNKYFASLVEEEDENILQTRRELASLRNRRKRDMKAEELAELDTLESHLKRRRGNAEECIKKIEKKREEFDNLINFVSQVSKDPFWSAEMVQFIADTTYMGELSLRIIPRSGNFEIEFGTLGKSAEKLAKLNKFYDTGLPHVGWDRFKTVDVRYNKQIICKE